VRALARRRTYRPCLAAWHPGCVALAAIRNYWGDLRHLRAAAYGMVQTARTLKMRISPANHGFSTIVTRYKDALGKWRRVSSETRAALSKAMGEPDGTAEEQVIVVRRGTRKRVRAPAEITFEDGGVLKLETSTLPRDLPPGYHRLRYPDQDQPVRLIVSPGASYLPEDLRIWGWSAQLYALRSAASWGIGDFADLKRLAEWSAKDLGAGLLLVNPLHATAPIRSQQPSPYFPSSRRYRNLLYLRIEAIPGAAD